MSEDSRFTHGKVVTGVDGRDKTQRSDEGSGTIAEGGGGIMRHGNIETTERFLRDDVTVKVGRNGHVEDPETYAFSLGLRACERL